jgi:putative two-component system response regulator
MKPEDGRSILIVDDEEHVRRIIERSLGSVGYEHMEQADSVAAARRAIEQKGPFALLLLDIMMPGLPGTDLLRELAPRAPGTVVVVATAVAQIETAVEALKLGAYDYLVKPLTPDSVRLAVARALRRRRLELQERLDHERVEKLAQQRVEALEATRQALLKSLCDMVEFRDAETGAHLRRMPAYAGILAEDMAQHSAYGDLITDEFVTQLVESAPLHDIGKVSVPDRLLLKRGPLTDEEFDVVKLHTVHGRQICTRVQRAIGENGAGFIKMAIEVTGSHHERWDGKGYPDGLAGAAIPLSGRIVHLCDFYDACRSPRVYRPEPIPRREVVGMIEEGHGTQFCPETVQSFKRSFDRFVEVEETISGMD